MVRKENYLESAWHVDWLLKQKDVDWKTLDYPTVERYVALDGEKRVAFLHQHAGLIVESVAFNPDSDAKERLEAVVELVNTGCKAAMSVGIKEAYYMSSDERTDEAAMKHLGFEPVKMYRKRL